MNAGHLFVISAPSGTGKTTILADVMAAVDNLAFSISHTTREPRSGEMDGVDYHFVTRERFRSMIEDGLFLEYADVHGNYYGTSSASVLAQVRQGLDVILDIDTQGAAILQDSQAVGGPVSFIFIAPPSLEELESRLRGRGTESEEKIRLRLKNAEIEMQAAERYDYLLVNKEVEEAVEVLRSIIIAERAKERRGISGKPVTFACRAGGINE